MIPPKIDLPPPASAAAEAPVPNWPKDPDVKRRKEAKAARKKDNKDPVEAARPLTPSELAVGKTAARPSAPAETEPARRSRRQRDPQPVAARL